MVAEKPCVQNMIYYLGVNSCREPLSSKYDLLFRY